MSPKIHKGRGHKSHKGGTKKSLRERKGVVTFVVRRGNSDVHFKPAVVQQFGIHPPFFQTSKLGRTPVHSRPSSYFLNKCELTF